MTLKQAVCSSLLMLSLGGGGMAHAHGVHFDSVEALREHLQAHLARLERAASAPSIDAQALGIAYEEIIEHARAYQRMCRSEERPWDAKTAVFLDGLCDRLIESAGNQQLVQCLRLMSMLEAGLPSMP